MVFENQVREGSQAQAAIVVMSADGAVRAMVAVGTSRRGRPVQPRDPGQPADRVGLQSPSSTQRHSTSGIRPTTGCGRAEHHRRAGVRPWSPRNYTNDSKGQVTLTDALAHRSTSPPCGSPEFVGRDVVRDIASGFGIDSDLAAGPALALGASESTPAGNDVGLRRHPDGGSAVEPYGLLDLRLKGETASLIDQTGGMGERVNLRRRRAPACLDDETGRR